VPRTVGGREWAGLPDLGVHAIRARVDRGAPASSLVAQDIELAGGPDGPIVRFTVRPDPAGGADGVTAEAPLVDLRDIPAADGVMERRPVIRTRLLLAGLRCPIELSLTSGRDPEPDEAPAEGNGHPGDDDRAGEGDTVGEAAYGILVGRRALRRRFHVDPDRSFVGGGTATGPPA